MAVNFKPFADMLIVTSTRQPGKELVTTPQLAILALANNYARRANLKGFKPSAETRLWAGTMDEGQAAAHLR